MKNKNKMPIFIKILLSTFIFCTSGILWAQQAPTGYCAAIRGNGELIPAQWGAMARITENYGLPQTMAGGSSASITIFLIESIAKNPLIANITDEDEKKIKISFLIKTFEEYVLSLTETNEGKAIISIMGDQKLKNTILNSINKIQPPGKAGLSPLEYSNELYQYALKYSDQIKTLFNSPQLRFLINPDLVEYANKTKELAHHYQENNDPNLVKIIEYRINELTTSIKKFGTFDAETSYNLLFRPGLINFKGIAFGFNRMANFYSGFQFDKNDVAAINTLLSTCAKKETIGKSWNIIKSSSPKCAAILVHSINQYRNKTDLIFNSNPRIGRLSDRISGTIKSFVSTATIEGESSLRLIDKIKEYQTTIDPRFGESFQANTNDLKFGYWGRPRDLLKVQNNLKTYFSEDQKSKRFKMILNNNSDDQVEKWFNIISFSPAEPGLSNAPLLQNQKRPIFSVGGWSDLEPTLVLKASGCANIIYITRQGPESKFAQGVAKRILPSLFKNVPWEQFSKEQVIAGNSFDMTSAWSKLYNTKNSKSSFTISLLNSDAIYCTDWDSFDIFSTGIKPVIENAYHSPFSLKENQTFFARFGNNQLLSPFKKITGCN